MKTAGEVLRLCVVSINDRPTLFGMTMNKERSIYVAFRDISANFTRDKFITPDDNLFSYADIKRLRTMFGRKNVMTLKVSQRPDHWKKKIDTPFIKVAAIATYVSHVKTDGLLHPKYPEELVELLSVAATTIYTDLPLPAKGFSSNRWLELREIEKKGQLFDLVDIELKKQDLADMKQKKKAAPEQKESSTNGYKTLYEKKKALADKLVKDAGIERDELLSNILTELKVTNGLLENLLANSSSGPRISEQADQISGQLTGIRKALFGPFQDNMVKVFKDTIRFESQGEEDKKGWFRTWLNS